MGELHRMGIQWPMCDPLNSQLSVIRTRQFKSARSRVRESPVPPWVRGPPRWRLKKELCSVVLPQRPPVLYQVGTEWGLVDFQGWVGSCEVPASHFLKLNRLVSWCSAQVKPFDLLQSCASSPSLPSMQTGALFSLFTLHPNLLKSLLFKVKKKKLG